MKKIRIILASLVFFLIFAGSIGFKLFDPGRQSRKSVPLPMVRTIPVALRDIAMILPGEGTVRPVSEIQLIPEISGKVVYVSPRLTNGGTFTAGERLLAIEPDDYNIAVTMAEAGVKNAQSRYELALQESEAARSEWTQLNPGKKAPSLVGKKPQLEAARAELNARKATLEKARLNLKRTEIFAPFNGRVSAESVNSGQFINSGQALATLCCTDTAEVIVPMQSSALTWFDAPGFNTNSKTGALAEVITEAGGRKRTWTGEVDRVDGCVDEKTRMVNVVVRIAKPYATDPPLAIGQLAQIRIKGATLTGGAVIPRAALHGDSTVWTVDPGKGRLFFRNIEIARMDRQEVVVRSGLKSTDHLIVSPLNAPRDGMPVRIADAG